jgi:hypothetical protein
MIIRIRTSGFSEPVYPYLDEAGLDRNYEEPVRVFTNREDDHVLQYVFYSKHDNGCKLQKFKKIFSAALKSWGICISLNNEKKTGSLRI